MSLDEKKMLIHSSTHQLKKITLAKMRTRSTGTLDTGAGISFLLNTGTGTVHSAHDGTIKQGCESGSGLDPDSVTLLDPDPYWESGSGSRGKKIKKFHF
jgi:hypothetical protein